jgi:multiple sugar transport system substrate-binding protein
MLGSSLVPDVDGFLTRVIQQWSDANGSIPFEIEFVPQPLLPYRVSRALLSGEQRDIVELQDLQPFRFTSKLLDVSDIATGIESRNGGFEPWATETVRVQDTWYSVPVGAQLAGLTYRPSLLEAAGLTPDVLRTWDGVVDAIGSIFDRTGKPGAFAFGQTPIASTAIAYAWMWAHGGAELLPGSRQVSFDSPELRDALTRLQKAIGTGSLDRRGPKLDDSSLHDAITRGEIGIAVCGASPYLAGRYVGDTDIAVAPIPSGPAGTFVPLGSRSFGITARTERVEDARNLLDWLLDPVQFTSIIVAHGGAIVPPGQGLQELPVFSQDPNIVAIAAGTLAGRRRGWSAAPSESMALVASHQFVVNTFADVASGTDVAMATARGQELMERFYTRQRD